MYLKLSFVDFNNDLNINNMIEGIDILCNFCNHLK